MDEDQGDGLEQPWLLTLSGAVLVLSLPAALSWGSPEGLLLVALAACVFIWLHPSRVALAVILAAGSVFVFSTGFTLRGYLAGNILYGDQVLGIIAMLFFVVALTLGAALVGTQLARLRLPAALPLAVLVMTLAAVSFGTVTAWDQFRDEISPDPSPAVSFDSADLELAVGRQLGRRPGFVTQANMADLTVLELESWEIDSLTGMEYAVNLRALVITDNSIQDLAPLAGLTQLRCLLAAGNAITDLAPLVQLAASGGLSMGPCEAYLEPRDPLDDDPDLEVVLTSLFDGSEAMEYDYISQVPLLDLRFNPIDPEDGATALALDSLRQQMDVFIGEGSEGPPMMVVTWRGSDGSYDKERVFSFPR